MLMVNDSKKNLIEMLREKSWDAMLQKTPLSHSEVPGTIHEAVYRFIENDTSYEKRSEYDSTAQQYAPIIQNDADEFL